MVPTGTRATARGGNSGLRGIVVSGTPYLRSNLGEPLSYSYPSKNIIPGDPPDPLRGSSGYRFHLHGADRYNSYDEAEIRVNVSWLYCRKSSFLAFYLRGVPNWQVDPIQGEWML
jgi:hypothetical protein